ncbi:TRAP transporter large permease [Corynebacterium sp. A21]|uniref:TRAP transporter large permease n=1 Tax=Corynebacterium sp. A21 TaxID=3457318 RepID=UPI003FCFB48F
MSIAIGEKAPEDQLKSPLVGSKQLSSRPSSIVLTVLLAVLLGEIVLILSGALETKTQVALACIILLLTLMACRVPIAVAMGLAGLLGIWRISGSSVMERSLVDLPASNGASWSLSVIPMFIFMGLLLWKSGSTARIFDAARAWLNWLPGGLAITTNIAGAGLAAASGSTIGIAYAISRIGIPEMLKSGYDKRLAVGSVIMAGLPGQLIPPSLLLVVYAGIANLPVGPQLLAGVVPGILLALVVNVAILILALVFPGLAGKKLEGAGWSARWESLAQVWPMPVLVMVVLGGLYGGFFTATEAAAVGCIGALIITAAYIRGKEFWKAVGSALSGTVLATGSVFFLLIGAAFVTRMLALSEIPFMFTQWIDGMGLTATQFVIAAVIVLIVLGMFMDPISLMLLSIPVMLPTLNTLGIDLLWFGVIVVLAAEIGMLTPPVGVLVFLIHKIAQAPEVNLGQNITLGTVFGSALMGVPLALLVIALLIIFPELVTWLPSGGDVVK